MIRAILLSLAVSVLVHDNALAACGSRTARATRFVLKQAEAYDPHTGLTWQRCSVGMTWKKGHGCAGERALLSVEDAMKAARAAGPGWRVPSVKELYTLVDTACGTPPADVTAFPDLHLKSEDSASYWTASEVGAAGLVYYIDFATGEADAHSRGYNLAVRLVRSGA